MGTEGGGKDGGKGGGAGGGAGGAMRRGKAAERLVLGKGCYACRRPVGQTDCEELGGQVFHGGCLRCAGCGLNESRLRLGLGLCQGRLLCGACLQSGRSGRCRLCERPLRLSEARSLGGRPTQPGPEALFHRACLRCQRPGCPLLLPLGPVARQGSRLFCSLRCCLLWRRDQSALPAEPSLPADFLPPTPDNQTHQLSSSSLSLTSSARTTTNAS